MQTPTSVEILAQREALNARASGLPRCCDGSSHVLPNGTRVAPSWAVICSSCDRCLAVVDGPRSEVFADL